MRDVQETNMMIVKEIINSSKAISTPLISVRLERRSDGSIPEELARIVKGRIECLYLEDITDFIQISHPTARSSCIYLKLNMDTIVDFGLDINPQDVMIAIKKYRRFAKAELNCSLVKWDEIKISAEGSIKSAKRGAAAKVDDNAPNERLMRLQTIRRLLPSVHILGYPQARRAVVMAEDDPKSDEIIARRRADKLVDPDAAPPAISSTNLDTDVPIKQEGGVQPDPNEAPIKQEIGSSSLAKPSISTKPVQMHKLMISGYGLKQVLTTPGVDFVRTQTNSIMETLNVLGIEAARSKIITEIAEVMKELNIDPRHMALLADVMTYKGEVLGITRFGLAKMRDSVLQLASFEKTADHLFAASETGKKDSIEGVSECVIVGKTMAIGTGSVEIARRMNMTEKEVCAKPCLFEDAWADS